MGLFSSKSSNKTYTQLDVHQTTNNIDKKTAGADEAVVFGAGEETANFGEDALVLGKNSRLTLNNDFNDNVKNAFDSVTDFGKDVIGKVTRSSDKLNNLLVDQIDSLKADGFTIKEITPLIIIGVVGYLAIKKLR